MEIVNLLYNLARTQISVRGFIYGKAYNKGAGTDAYPLVWLDDPITAGTVNELNSALRYTVNVDILDIPKSDADVLGIQSAALTIGLSFREKLKNKFGGVSVESFNFITLRDYYDDNAAGVRMTYSIVAPNPLDICEEYFDDNKQFLQIKDLPDFSTENPNGCAVFNDKAGLPSFNV